MINKRVYSNRKILPNFTLEKKNNKDNSSLSLYIKKKPNNGNEVFINNKNIKSENEKEKDKISLNEENNNKSKIEFLNLGKSPNKIKKKKSIFKQTLIIMKKETLLEDIKKQEMIKTPVKFNSFYYYCFSKLKNNNKNREMITLFNFAISFYKQKLDIIYFFHIILLIEKIISSEKDKMIIEDETFFNLNDK